MAPEETGYEDVDCIQLAEDRVQWQEALVNLSKDSASWS
jgi:hypothetical protein